MPRTTVSELLRAMKGAWSRGKLRRTLQVAISLEPKWLRLAFIRMRPDGYRAGRRGSDVPERPKAAKAELPESVPGEAVARGAKAHGMPNHI